MESPDLKQAWIMGALGGLLGTPVVPFYPFCLVVSLLNQSIRKKGTLVMKGLLGALGGLNTLDFGGSQGAS